MKKNVMILLNKTLRIENAHIADGNRRILGYSIIGEMYAPTVYRASEDFLNRKNPYK